MSNNGNFGGIYYVKKGRAHPVWRARVVVNDERHTRNFAKRIDAERWLEDLRVQFSTNTFEVARAAERISFGEAAERYRKEKVADTEMKKLDAVMRHGGAGVERRLHDLRHEGTSWLFENAHKLGLTDHDISLVTSHRSAVAMKRYIHLKSASVVDRIDGNMKSEMQRFVEDLLIDGEANSIQLAVAITRKRKEFADRQESHGVTIDGESIRIAAEKPLPRIEQ